jgi:hypothetical protein
MMKVMSIVLAVGLGVSGCSKNEDAGSGKAAAKTASQTVDEAEAKREADDKSASSSTGPCELLTEDMVRAAFSIPAETDVEHRPNQANYCGYTWKKANAAELKKEKQKLIQEQIKRMTAAKNAKERKAAMAAATAQPKEHAAAHISLPRKKFKSNADAKSAYASAVVGLKKGFTTATGTDGEFETQEVSGVGDAAHWSTKMKQLTVLLGSRLFHVGVDLEPDANQNLEHAKKLAIEIAKK